MRLDDEPRWGEESGGLESEANERPGELEERSLPWGGLFLRLALRGGELLRRSHPSLRLRQPASGRRVEGTDDGQVGVFAITW